MPQACTDHLLLLTKIWLSVAMVLLWQLLTYIANHTCGRWCMSQITNMAAHYLWKHSKSPSFMNMWGTPPMDALSQNYNNYVHTNVLKHRRRGWRSTWQAWEAASPFARNCMETMSSWASIPLFIKFTVQSLLFVPMWRTTVTYVMKLTWNIVSLFIHTGKVDVDKLDPLVRSKWLQI